MFADAFLASWNDVDPLVEVEYQRWHRVEHMPERLGIRGFVIGRRYVDPAGPMNRYLTVYEAQSLDVFASDAYRTRLASPTPETARMASHMRNFVRRICRTVATNGVAIGGAAAVFQLQLGRAERASAIELTQKLCALDGTAAAHFGRVDEMTTNLRSDRLQNQMAIAGPPAFDAVCIVETDTRATATARLAAWTKLIDECATGTCIATVQIYDLALLYRPGK